MRSRRRSSRRLAPLPRQEGFTYLGLVIFVTIVGLVGAATLKVGSLLQRAAAEEELLEIGAAYSAALQSYAAATPRGQPTQPPNLEHLLRDPRFPGVRRHLRKIFVDPITGTTEWGVQYLGDKVGAAGADGFLLKPYAPEQLIQMIEATLKGAARPTGQPPKGADAA